MTALKTTQIDSWRAEFTADKAGRIAQNAVTKTSINDIALDRPSSLRLTRP